MLERTGHWIIASSMQHLKNILNKLDEYLNDVQYDIINECKCGRIEAFVHYIV